MDEQECQWLTTPSEDLRCIICLCVAQEPHQHGRCGKLFCRLCAQQLFKEHRDYQNLAKFKMEAHSLSDQAIVVSDDWDAWHVCPGNTCKELSTHWSFSISKHSRILFVYWTEGIYETNIFNYSSTNTVHLSTINTIHYLYTIGDRS